MRIEELAAFERSVEERIEWVEQRLRRGVLELDERADALAKTARSLEAEAARLADAGTELSRRETSLGELARAFNERGARLEAAERELVQREGRLAAREARLVRLFRRVNRRRLGLAAVPLAAPAAEQGPARHLLLVATAAGYTLHERDGFVPDRGAVVPPLGDEGTAYRVTGSGPSPLPGDRRRCAYLEPAPVA